MQEKPVIRCKRVYDGAMGDDGQRVLAEWLENELARRGPGSSPVCYAQ